jgi:hypothetical protein
MKFFPVLFLLAPSVVSVHSGHLRADKNIRKEGGRDPSPDPFKAFLSCWIAKWYGEEEDPTCLPTNSNVGEDNQPITH